MINKISAIVFLLTVQISVLFGQEPAKVLSNDSLSKSNYTMMLKVASISQTGLVTFVPLMFESVNIQGAGGSSTVQIANFNNPNYAVFIITRHAEKVSADPNSGLTEAGKNRAIRLSKILKEVKLAKIASTNTIRTMATAQPTATDKGLQITPYTVALPFVQNLINTNKGKKHLVVGHSDTVPPLLNTLGGTPNKFTVNDEFNNLYIVVVNQVGQATVRHFKY